LQAEFLAQEMKTGNKKKSGGKGEKKTREKNLPEGNAHDIYPGVTGSEHTCSEFSHITVTGI